MSKTYSEGFLEIPTTSVSHRYDGQFCLLFKNMFLVQHCQPAADSIGQSQCLNDYPKAQISRQPGGFSVVAMQGLGSQLSPSSRANSPWHGPPGEWLRLTRILSCPWALGELLTLNLNLSLVNADDAQGAGKRHWIAYCLLPPLSRKCSSKEASRGLNCKTWNRVSPTLFPWLPLRVTAGAGVCPPPFLQVMWNPAF